MYIADNKIYTKGNITICTKVQQNQIFLVFSEVKVLN